MGVEDQPPGSTGPEQPNTLRPEIPKPTLLQFSLREKNASEADKRRIGEMNVLLKGFSIIGYFTEPFKAQLVEESEIPSEGNPYVSERLQHLYQDSSEVIELSGRFLALVKMENENVDHQKLVIRDFTGQDPEVVDITKIAAKLKQDYAGKINGAAQKFLSANPEIKIIQINPSQIDSLEAKFRQAFHDLVNPLNRIAGYMDLYSIFAPMEDQFTQLNDALSSFINSYDTLEKSFSDVYEKEKLPLNYILIIAKKILPHLNLRRSQIPKNLKDIIIPSWAEGWLNLLFEDIAQNISRSFGELEKAGIKRDEGEQVAIKFRSVDENGNKDPQGIFVEIDIEDNGIGIPPELLGGFKEGLTNWGGSKKVGKGTAMAIHSVVLREKYGGELSAENILGKNGEVKGARIKIRIPINFPQS